MKRLQLAFTAALTVALLAVVGCSKNESKQSPPPPKTIIKLAPASPSASPSAPAIAPAPAPPAETTEAEPAEVTPAPEVAEAEASEGEESTPAQLAAKLKKLESDYENGKDLQKRVVTIYDISAVESPYAVDTIGHLFLKEKDQELKIELINSLTDIEGQNDKKLAIYNSAMRTDQPKEVRIEAIDGIGELTDKRGIQVLQGLANDPDEEVKEAVHDAIEQLRAMSEPVR